MEFLTYVVVVHTNQSYDHHILPHILLHSTAICTSHTHLLKSSYYSSAGSKRIEADTVKSFDIRRVPMAVVMGDMPLDNI